ncbi:four helix bundle protein [Clostridium guangxiense]|uniref:four helix bundle protein n=1 Tax=Clostridium guangxiense TaxID=1662055 RepID=UPI001E49972A|nr:four helix bundle protein [Clostridium guangxiense]
MEKSALLKESFNVALESINVYKYLSAKNEYVLSKQFFRAATSIGANIREAKYAESKNDFIHKFRIALKECNETLYWLELIEVSEGQKIKEVDYIRKKCNSILRMIVSSIQTCEKNLENANRT